MPRRIDRTEFNFVPSWRIDGPSRGPPLTDRPTPFALSPTRRSHVKHHNIGRKCAQPIGPQYLEQAMRVGGEGGVDQA